MAKKIHYDYIEARKYAEERGKKLKELSAEEMKLFEVKAVSIGKNKEEIVCQED